MSSRLAPTYYQATPKPITDRTWWDNARQRLGQGYMHALRDFTRSVPVDARSVQATDYLAAQRNNDRSLTDRRWQYDRHLVSLMALRLCLDGPDHPLDDDPHDDRLVNWLWSVMNDASWCVVAHLPGKTLPDLRDPILDLAACEMASFLAELREVLLPWLERISPAFADSIVCEVDRHVLSPLVANPERWGWNKATNLHINNWTGVCAGSVLSATRSLHAQGLPRTEADRIALAALKRFFERAFTPDGECDEGVSYWSYGMLMACVGLSRLDREEIEAHLDIGRLRQVASYPGRSHLAGRTFWAGNDSALVAIAPRGFVPWLAAATGDAFLKVWPGLDLAPPDPYSPGSWLRSEAIEKQQRTRHFAAVLRALHAPPEWCAPADSAPSTPPGGRLLRDQQAALFTRNHPRGILSICMAGGHNDESHNHNDLGHLTVVLNEEMLLPDFGAPHYTSDFFGPKRYEYTVAGSQGHSCPRINGHEQRPGRDAAGVVLKYDPHGAFSLDLSTAYPADAHLIRWHRILTCPMSATDTPTFTVADEYELDVKKLAASTSHQRPQGEIVQRWWLSHAPKLGTDYAETSDLLLRFIPAPNEIRVSVMTDHQLLLRAASPDGQMYRLEAVYRGASLRLVTAVTVR